MSSIAVRQALSPEFYPENGDDEELYEDVPEEEDSRKGDQSGNTDMENVNTKRKT